MEDPLLHDAYAREQQRYQRRQLASLEQDLYYQTAGVVFFSIGVLGWGNLSNLCVSQLQLPLCLFIFYLGLFCLPITVVQRVTLRQTKRMSQVATRFSVGGEVLQLGLLVHGFAVFLSHRQCFYNLIVMVYVVYACMQFLKYVCICSLASLICYYNYQDRRA